MSAKKKAIVIGAGMGGIAAAIRLARAGYAVKLLERAETLGGKLREVTVGGRAFDAGPSVFTMRYVFEDLFGGPEKLTERVKLHPLDPLCRHFFPDGSVLDLSTDAEKSRAAIAAFSSEQSARGYLAYRKHCAKIYEIVRGPFMEGPMTAAKLLTPGAILGMTQADGMRTMWKSLEEFFPDPRLRQLFGRYATYNGSSPYHAPGTLGVIVHVENHFGVFSIDRGLYRLCEAMAELARELGVEVATGVEVEEVMIERGSGFFSEDRAVGVKWKGGQALADVIIANCDVAHLYERLLPSARGAEKLAKEYTSQELSLSAYVLLSVAKTPPIDLLHHNVFFSPDYPSEFRELVDETRAPYDPTVYLNAQDRVTPGITPPGSERCFFLSNAPPRRKNASPIDWVSESPRARERIARVLARHKWTLASEAEGEITPVDLEKLIPSSRGAIYGLASNSKMAAFKRPQNRVQGIQNLYAVGGSAHPGAGIPMCLLSAKIAVELATSRSLD